jgi:hypothetical protein
MGWFNGAAGESTVIFLTLVLGVLTILFLMVMQIFTVWDGVRQMATGRYALLPIDKVFRNRLPFSTSDCVLQGASRVFGSIGVFLIVLPGLLNGIVAAADVVGIARVGPVGLIVMLAGMVICWPIGLALVVGSTILGKKVNYRYLNPYEA